MSNGLVRASSGWRAGEPENSGLVDWLPSCPEKDWFAPVASESAADLRDPEIEGR